MKGSLTIREALSKKILVLDGAMGTMIQQRGFIGNNESLNLDNPDLVASIHDAYIDAGADIIETNSFSANRISQQEYGMQAQAREMAYRAAVIARRCADVANRRFAAEGLDRHVFVAGSMGPTSKSLTLCSDVDNPSFRKYSFDEMSGVFAEQAAALVEGGVDLLLLETCFDALNAKAALYAIKKTLGDFPVIVSVSCNDRSGRTLTGQTLEAFYRSVIHYPLTAFGVNCSLGPAEILPLLKEAGRFVKDCPLICFPNAGMPDELGRYGENPVQFGMYAGKMAQESLLNITGGCCGTTPEHIGNVAAMTAAFAPRICSPEAPRLHPCGLEALTVDKEKYNFCNIGERTNVAGSRKFARLISEGKYDEALGIAAGQIENGASIIDINMDDGMLDAPREMETFVRYIQNDPAVAKAALMIDSSSWDAILAGLKNSQGKCIVNSISLKDGEEEFLRKASEIHALGAAMVVMAFDEEGQATTFERKIQIAKRAYNLLTAAGIPAEDIIMDVNVLSIGTGIREHSRYGLDFLDAVRWIKQNLPGVYTSGGISNLSFAFRGNNPVREAMHSVFLYHAVRAGLDMGIVNPGMLQPYDEIDTELRQAIEDVIFDRGEDAEARLLSIAGNMTGRKNEVSAAKTEESDGKYDAAKRLTDAIVGGRGEHLEADLMLCLQEAGTPVNVIEGPLMRGMEKVGEMFGEGKMFLPQVVKSARIMKDAVDILAPYMKEESNERSGRPVFLLATVKGDVHDIGKNITGSVLQCNGFDVIDLGVMVDKETILAKAEEYGAAIIGVSGLITPSLFQMEDLCREMAGRKMDTPLFVGGATTSALHTAVKLAPLYPNVVYCADASQTAVKAKKCMMDRSAFFDEEKSAAEKLRSIYGNRRSDGCANLPGFPPDSYLAPGDIDCRTIECEEVPFANLLPFIDWRLFLATLGIKTDGQGNPETERLLSEGKALLRQWEEAGTVSCKACLRILHAYSKDDEIICFDDSSGDKVVAVLPMLREKISLCDYVPDSGYGIKGPLGIFALSVNEIETVSEYERMLARALRVTLAEAASCHIEDLVRSGIRTNEKKPLITRPAVGYPLCPDHTMKKDILSLLPGSEGLGISFTESYAMVPDASICGFICIHPHASYEGVTHIGMEQYEAYSIKRGFSSEDACRFLGFLL